jgi:hypothetical protein
MDDIRRRQYQKAPILCMQINKKGDLYQITWWGGIPEELGSSCLGKILSL